MSILTDNLLTTLRPLAKRLLPWIYVEQPSHARPMFRVRRNPMLSPAKQAELNKLCEQLLRKQELVTSGKLQFLGLSKIKRRLGRKWPGLSRVVYETAEEIINHYLDDRTDFYVRYKEEIYFLIFTEATLEEGQAKATLIAADIRKRLFEMDQKELRDLELRESVSVISHKHMEDLAFCDFLGNMAEKTTSRSLEDPDSSHHHGKHKPSKKKTPPPKQYRRPPPLPPIECIEVDAQDCRPDKLMPSKSLLPRKLEYAYLPIWDMSHNALSTYLCLARAPKQDYTNLFDAHKALYDNITPEKRLSLEVDILRAIIRELCAMQKDGRDFVLACPVEYATLHEFASYERYKNIVQTIPPELRRKLIFYVTDIKHMLPVQDAYWFATPLKEYCHRIFAEVPLRRDINFHYLHNLQVDAVGFRLEGIDTSDKRAMQMISQFSYRAKALQIPMTFIFELDRITHETAAIFTEYDYVAGDAIHKEVASPDPSHSFHSEELLFRLMRQLRD